VLRCVVCDVGDGDVCLCDVCPFFSQRDVLKICERCIVCERGRDDVGVA